MQVVFARDWFGPEGIRYRKRENPHEIGEELRNELPSDAIIDGKRRSGKQLEQSRKANAKADDARERERKAEEAKREADEAKAASTPVPGLTEEGESAAGTGAKPPHVQPLLDLQPPVKK